MILRYFKKPNLTIDIILIYQDGVLKLQQLDLLPYPYDGEDYALPNLLEREGISPDLLQTADLIYDQVCLILDGKNYKQALSRLKPYLISQKSELLEDILQKLWHTVEWGQTSSYKDYAIHLGLGANYARVVARAVASNFYPVIYPCHRLVSASGTLGKKFGVSGGLAVKRILLSNEGVELP